MASAVRAGMLLVRAVTGETHCRLTDSAHRIRQPNDDRVGATGRAAERCADGVFRKNLDLASRCYLPFELKQFLLERIIPRDGDKSFSSSDRNAQCVSAIALRNRSSKPCLRR